MATQVAPVPAEAPVPRAAAQRMQPRTAARSGGLLAQKASDEYVYVARDLRRIGTFAAGVAAIMLVVWFLVDLAKVVSI